MRRCLSFPRCRFLTLLVGCHSLWLGSLLWLAGCASQLPPVPPIPPQDMQQVANQLELTSQIENHALATYKIEAGDLLHIDLPGYPELSRDVLVEADGTFYYAHIGTVETKGRTLTQLKNEMVPRLAQRGITTPDLVIRVVEYGRQQVYVLGAVHRPGVYPLQPTTTFLSLIAQTGGTTAEAGWLALVIRDARKYSQSESNSQEDTAHTHARVARRFDLQKILLGEGPPDFHLASGDTLFIPQGAHFQVMGHVQFPGRYRLERGTTVLKAIAQAGGFTMFAAKNRLKVWRYHVHDDKCGGELCLRFIARFTIDQPRQFRIHLHDVVEPGDIIVVPWGFLF